MHSDLHFMTETKKIMIAWLAYTKFFLVIQGVRVCRHEGLRVCEHEGSTAVDEWELTQVWTETKTNCCVSDLKEDHQG